MSGVGGGAVDAKACHWILLSEPGSVRTGANFAETEDTWPRSCSTPNRRTIYLHYFT
jgi:hypothetical protein